MAIYLLDVPTENNRLTNFTREISGRIQRYALTCEALTDLTGVNAIHSAAELTLFEPYKARILEVAKRPLSLPSSKTIRLMVNFFP